MCNDGRQLEFFCIGVELDGHSLRPLQISADFETPPFEVYAYLSDTVLRVRAEISSQFLVLRRPLGKARKRRNIRHIPSFRNAAMRDASALKM
jgi:hypothetical protein